MYIKKMENTRLPKKPRGGKKIAVKNINF